MAILAAILHISDIEFVTDSETDGVFVKNDDVLVLGESSVVGFTYSLNFKVLATPSNCINSPVISLKHRYT